MFPGLPHLIIGLNYHKLLVVFFSESTVLSTFFDGFPSIVADVTVLAKGITISLRRLWNLQIFRHRTHVPIPNGPPCFYLVPCTRSSFALKTCVQQCLTSARTLGIFVTRDRKYQTCLIFGLHVTNDKTTPYVARTLGDFVNQTCHE